MALDVVAVSEVHRGAVHERQGVASWGPGSGCGLELREGESYVVFASAEPDAVELAPGQDESGPCSGTGPWPDERWAGLEEAVGAAPEPPRPGAAGTSPDLLPWGPAPAGAGALLLVGGWVLLRRVRRRRGGRGPER